MNEAAQHFVTEYHGQTTINPLGLAMVLTMGIVMLRVPRGYAVWPVVVVVCFVPSAQRVVLLGGDFTLLRLMVLFGTVRIVLREEWRAFAWKPLDWAVVVWALYGFVINVARIGPAVILNRTGYLYDTFGMYFIFRMLVRDWGDVRAAIRGFMWVSLPVAGFFVVEWASRRNPFSVFGGVPEITVVRDGRLRCQGAFDHPILAGCFFASLMPLMAAEWWQRDGNRKLVVGSMAAGLAVVLVCASATPLTGVAFAVIGALMFPLRRWMRAVRWGLLAMIVALHLVMKAPVWHLVSRVSVVGGNSSWHRYQLIDGAIRHYNEWWIMGSSVGTEHWGEHTFDVTNIYIVQGLHGGLVQLALFIAVIALAFRAVGHTWRAVQDDRRTMVLAWGLGVSMLVHATNIFGVSYFGQIWMSWYLVLAMIGSVAPHKRQSAYPVQNLGTRFVLAPARHGSPSVVVHRGAVSRSPGAAW